MKSELDGADDVWEKVSNHLKKNLNANVFSIWIAPLKFFKIENQICIFKVSTKFTGEWVERNYGDMIRQYFLRENCHIERIAFEVARVDMAQPARPLAQESETAEHTSTEKALSAGSAPSPEGQKERADNSDFDFPQGALDPRLTFENFIVGAANELAYSAARRVGRGEGVSFNPLFFYGGIGLGKTHLMQAIAAQRRINTPEAKIFYLSAEQFTYRFVQSIRARSTVDFKTLLRSLDVLLIDDIQFIAGKSSTQDEFIHTFNALVDHGKQIIVSAACPPSAISGLNERIKSRLQSGLVVDLHPADYALRRGILAQKYAYQAPFHGDLRIDEPVFEFLAQSIQANIRALEGALNRLFAFGSLIKKPVTLEMAKECLSDLLHGAERKITLDDIMRHVCEHYGIDISDMLGAQRMRTVVRPRQIAMYLAKKLTSRSYPEIGRRFGGRDHTTVLHAVRKIGELRAENEEFSHEIELLNRRLYSA